MSYLCSFEQNNEIKRINGKYWMAAVILNGNEIATKVMDNLKQQLDKLFFLRKLSFVF